MKPKQLKKIPLFSDASDEELKPVAVFAEEEDFKEGDVLTQEEGFSNDLFAIVDGKVEVTRGGEHVADLGKGDVFGEAGLLEDAQRNATVTAKSKGRLVKLGIFELKRLRRSAPRLYERIEQLAAERSG
jgi:CRP-like cAMP-binding protein